MPVGIDAFALPSLPHYICATTLPWRSVPLKFYFSEQIIVPVGPELYVTLYLVTFIVCAAFSPPHRREDCCPDICQCRVVPELVGW